MSKSIYFDYAATTPMDDRIVKKMHEVMTTHYGNPASQHGYGETAKKLIDNAREQVAQLIQAAPAEIIWTSGATEANNLALKGVAQNYQRKGKHIITMATEHKSVLDSCQYLEKIGYQVSYLAPQKNGLLDMEVLKNAIRQDTILISIMHVNNETGVIQDIQTIAQIAKEHDVLCHVDAAQSIGKIPINVTQMPVDLISLSSHKVYGPKGIGALYIRQKPRIRVAPLLHGGGHEQGMRSGTLATHQIVGMGEACLIANNEIKKDYQHVFNLRELFLTKTATLPIHLNIAATLSVPYILNLKLANLIAKAVLNNMPQLAVSTASACLGNEVEGSYVLKSLGLTQNEIASTLRISFGRLTTQMEVEELTDLLVKIWQ